MAGTDLGACPLAAKSKWRAGFSLNHAAKVSGAALQAADRRIDPLHLQPVLARFLKNADFLKIVVAGEIWFGY